MSCNANTILAEAATNGYFSPQPQDLEVILTQLCCDLKDAVTGYTSDPTVLAAGNTAFNHGLSAAPSLFWAVLVAVGADVGLGSSVGDVFTTDAFFDGFGNVQNFQLKATATQVIVRNGQFVPGNEGNISSEFGGPTSAANFKIKVFAKL